MSRMTYSKLKENMSNWNEAHPEYQMGLNYTADYYQFGHLYPETGAWQCVIAADKSPSGLWDKFCIWKDGYHVGYSKRCE